MPDKPEPKSTDPGIKLWFDYWRERDPGTPGWRDPYEWYKEGKMTPEQALAVRDLIGRYVKAGVITSNDAVAGVKGWATKDEYEGERIVREAPPDMRPPTPTPEPTRDPALDLIERFSMPGYYKTPTN